LRRAGKLAMESVHE